jgi:hypothetical protein
LPPQQNARPSVDTKQLCIPPATMLARDVRIGAEPVPGDGAAGSRGLDAGGEAVGGFVFDESTSAAAGLGSGAFATDFDSAFPDDATVPFFSSRAGLAGGATALTV